MQSAQALESQGEARLGNHYNRIGFGAARSRYGLRRVAPSSFDLTWAGPATLKFISALNSGTYSTACLIFIVNYCRNLQAEILCELQDTIFELGRTFVVAPSLNNHGTFHPRRSCRKAAGTTSCLHQGYQIDKATIHHQSSCMRRDYLPTGRSLTASPDHFKAKAVRG